MSRLNKSEYIARYGENAWAEESKKRVAQARAWQIKNADAHKEYTTRYNSEHKEYYKEYERLRWSNNKEKEQKRNKEYYNTKGGRAHNLIKLYRRVDSQANRGECTIDRNWIIEKIFSSSCTYCGESDWKKIGCDRIDNNLPHTPENVVCSCTDCNKTRQCKKMTVEEFRAYKQKGDSPIAIPTSE